MSQLQNIFEAIVFSRVLDAVQSCGGYTSRVDIPFGCQFIFCQTPVGARLIFSLLLLGVELIFANLPPGAGLFWSLENVAIPCEL